MSAPTVTAKEYDILLANYRALRAQFDEYKSCDATQSQLKAKCAEVVSSRDILEELQDRLAREPTLVDKLAAPLSR